MSDPISITLQNMSLCHLADTRPLSQTSKHHQIEYQIALAKKGKLLHRTCYEGQDPFIRGAWEKAGFPPKEGGEISTNQGYEILKRAVTLLKNYPLQKLCKFFKHPLSPEEMTALQKSDAPTAATVTPNLLRRLKALHHKLALNIADDPTSFFKFFELDRKEFVDMFFPFVSKVQKLSERKVSYYNIKDKIDIVFKEIYLCDGTPESDSFDKYICRAELRETSSFIPLIQKLEYLPEFFIRPEDSSLTRLHLENITFSLNLPFSIGSLRQLKELTIGTVDNGPAAWKWLPETIGELHELEKLAIQWCNVEKIPPEIKNLQKLTKFICCQTPLSVLPKEISELTNLKELLIWENKIETIPEDFFKNLSDLRVVDIAMNRLTTIPPGIGQLFHLEELRLDKNRIEQIPNECFEKLPNLRQLILSQNPLKTLPKTLRGCTKLQLLDITNTNLEATTRLLKTLICLRIGGCKVKCDQAILKEVERFESLYVFRALKNALP